MKTTQYNLWEVIDETKIYIDNRVYLKCRCECGVVKNVIIKNLKSGVSKSCGHKRVEALVKMSTRHNKRHTRVWRAWQAMKNRCGNRNTPQYKCYGGRGITVCDNWKNSFISFYNDVGDPPEGTSLDRINNDGNYEPGNVKWSTQKEQTRNRRSNRKIGDVCITDISKNLGGGHGLVTKRLKRGWSIEKATTLKSNANKQNPEN